MKTTIACTKTHRRGDHRRHAELRDAPGKPARQANIAGVDLVAGPAAREPQPDQAAPEQRPDIRRPGRAGHAPVEYGDEQRRQDQVGGQTRCHVFGRKRHLALAAEQHVQRQPADRGEAAGRRRPQVIGGDRHQLASGAHAPDQRFGKTHADKCVKTRYQQSDPEAGAGQPAQRILVAFSDCDREHHAAADAGQRAEAERDLGDRERQRDAGQRLLAQQLADIDCIQDRVQTEQQHHGHGRHGHGIEHFQRMRVEDQAGVRITPGRCGCVRVRAGGHSKKRSSNTLSRRRRRSTSPSKSSTSGRLSVLSARSCCSLRARKRALELPGRKAPFAQALARGLHNAFGNPFADHLGSQLENAADFVKRQHIGLFGINGFDRRAWFAHHLTSIPARGSKSKLSRSCS